LTKRRRRPFKACQIVRLDDAVAVVADHMGAAKKGLAALVIEWDDGPREAHHRHIAGELVQATGKPGRWRRTSGTSMLRRWPALSPKSRLEYHVPFLAHAALEPMNCTAHVDA
jgi:isoquinoline 1-oxidoreductase beta subunit